MKPLRLLAYGAAGAALAVPSLLIIALAAAGLVLTAVLIGLPLLLGGVVLVMSLAQADRWLARRLAGTVVDDPSHVRKWSRDGSVQVSREAAFVLARSAVGLGALALSTGAAVAAVAGIGVVASDGYLAGAGWRSTAGLASWWGPFVTVAAIASAAAVFVVAGSLQVALTPLLGPTEAARFAVARRRQASADERARLAADLHDAVGHSLTVMTVQAAAAARMVRIDPDHAVRALEQIETECRRALGEVDRAMALLTGGTPSDAPDASHVPDLLTALGVAGLQVTQDIRLPDGLPDAVSQAVYRVVQEAGTNALRHGDAGVLEVRIGADRRAVTVQVVNMFEPNGTRTGPGPGGGNGLDGLRARCAALDGEFTAGPSPDGADWVVTASLPWTGDTP